MTVRAMRWIKIDKPYIFRAWYRLFWIIQSESTDEWKKLLLEEKLIYNPSFKFLL